MRFTLNHPTGYLDDEIAETLADALKALLLAIAHGRTESTESLIEEEAAVREALLGFGILAFNETRAFLIVAGAGLDRHARIHFRFAVHCASIQYFMSTILGIDSCPSIPWRADRKDHNIRWRSDGVKSNWRVDRERAQYPLAQRWGQVQSIQNQPRLAITRGLKLPHTSSSWHGCAHN